MAESTRAWIPQARKNLRIFFRSSSDCRSVGAITTVNESGVNSAWWTALAATVVDFPLSRAAQDAASCLRIKDFPLSRVRFEIQETGREKRGGHSVPDVVENVVEHHSSTLYWAITAAMKAALACG